LIKSWKASWRYTGLFKSVGKTYIPDNSPISSFYNFGNLCT
jgi:hypothetical protein